VKSRRSLVLDDAIFIDAETKRRRLQKPSLIHGNNFFYKKSPFIIGFPTLEVGEAGWKRGMIRLKRIYNF
jgi:hypothetical protein